MRTNNTIQKHTLQIFILSLLLLCTIPCLPVAASSFDTTVSTSDTGSDNSGIEILSSDIG